MINKIIVSGRLTAKPELRHTKTQKSVASFTIAVQDPYSSKENPVVDFFNVSVWDKKAINAEKFLDKGSVVEVVGKLKNKNWTDKNGVKRYETEILAEELHFISNPKKQNLPQSEVPQEFLEDSNKRNVNVDADDFVG